MKNNIKAFTLIELLVVIAIIGILATISVITLSNARAKARDAKRIADTKQVATALELFFNDNNRYPTDSEFNSGQIGSSTAVYMQSIPQAPTPNDGLCTLDQNTLTYHQTENGGSYTISMCLGGSTGSLGAGPKCLTPGGIIDTDCSSSTPAFTCGTDSVSYGGETYPTVQIGTQCWFAKNLNIGTRIDSLDGNSDPQSQGDFSSGIQKYCYDDNDANCTTDGGLYEWHMATGLPQSCDSSNDSPCNISGTIQGICPTGWHVPTDSELGTPSDWRALEQYLGTAGCDSADDGCPPAGDKLKKAADCYSGSNCGTSGFDAPLAGYRRNNGSFNNRGDNAYSWSLLLWLDDPSLAWGRHLSSGNSEVYRREDNIRAHGLSVRCLKN